VSSPSYEARRYGVRSAMPTAIARRLCPQAIFRPPRMKRYVEVSKHVMGIFHAHTPLVEPLSLDEAFLDITGTEQLFGSPVEVARRVQDAITRELNLSASVGVAAVKYVAKVASDLKKPHGLVVVPPGEEQSFLEPLSLDRLWGVGPKTATVLRALGLESIGDVRRYGERALTDKLGSLGAHVFALSCGRDDRAVETDHEQKSLGSERTLEHDIQGLARVRHELLALVDDVAADLRRKGLRAGGVRLKVKYADFHRASRETQLSEPSQDAESLMRGLDALLPRLDLDKPMRLVGLAATHLVNADSPRQPSLFGAAPKGQDRAEKLGRALDAIHKRHGGDAIVRATAMDRRGEPARSPERAQRKLTDEERER
jgi:DNA polymerase IV